MLQARILEWVAIPFSRESFWPRDLTVWGTREAPSRETPIKQNVTPGPIIQNDIKLKLIGWKWSGAQGTCFSSDTTSHPSLQVFLWNSPSKQFNNQFENHWP